MEQGIIVQHCTGYDLPEFLRITVGNEAQNTRLVEVLEGVLRDLGHLRSA